MKLLHIVPSIGYASGGLGPVVLGLAKAQKELGNDVSIWCLDYQDNALGVADGAGLHGCVTIWPHTGPRMLDYSHLLAKYLLTDLHCENDIVHQHGIWTVLSCATFYLQQKCGMKSVVAPHGALDPYALQMSRMKKWLALKAYERRNLEAASCIHVLSKMEADSVRTFKLANQIAHIPNGIDATWLGAGASGQNFKCRFAIPRGQRVILFLSRIHPKKGLNLLIDALNTIGGQIFPEWTVVIAGPNELNHQEEIQARVAQSGLQAHVLFVGPLHGEMKRDAFAAAELYVLPSYSEGSPITVLEALGAGVPVITTKATPWQELITEQCGWWVDINAQSIAEAILEATNLTNCQLEELGLRGKRLVAEKYTWDKAAQRCLEVYQHLVA